MPLFYLLFAVFSVAAAAPRALNLPRPVEVRRAADPVLPVILELPQGERVWLIDVQGEFTRVKVQRNGRWKQGFVFTEDLSVPTFAEEAAPVGEWAVGAVFHYSVVTQGGRQFQTEDSVSWHTSAYTSTTEWPALFLQYRRENFWRLSLGLRSVHFRGTASANVGVSNTRKVTVDQTMYSGRLERAFTLYKPIYLILGGEVARATKLSETLGGVTIPTSSADLAVYAGGSAGLGVSFPIFGAVTVLAEARYGVYPTLKPTAVATEALAGAAYWF